MAPRRALIHLGLSFQKFLSNIILVFTFYSTNISFFVISTLRCWRVLNVAILFDVSRFETAELTNALACCASTLVPDRKEGLKALFTVISSDRQISTIDLRKIVERLNVLIGEGSHKVCLFSNY